MSDPCTRLQSRGQAHRGPGPECQGGTMSTTTAERVDVNAAFDAERIAQVGRIEELRSEAGQAKFIAEQTARFEQRVQAGELVRLSEGRYQSTAGWDRGEVWEVRSGHRPTLGP